MNRPSSSPPSPPPAAAVQVTARADAHRAREWWAKWAALEPIEPERSAAEVLAATRADDDI